jgi:hypothetical protein
MSLGCGSREGPHPIPAGGGDTGGLSGRSRGMEVGTLARWKRWQVLLLFATAQCGITALGVYFFDFFAGTATLGFGRMGPVSGTGMFFIYMLGALNALVVLLPVYRVGFFGVAALVYLPWAVIGFPVEYYYEWVLNRSLRSPWAVLGWCAMGPAAGLCADLAHRFLPRSLPPGWRATLTGAALGAGSYLTTLAALAFFYAQPLSTAPGSYAGLSYFGLPWLLLHSALGGYAAWALAGQARRARLPASD